MEDCGQGLKMSVTIKISSLFRKFTDGQEFVKVTRNSPVECVHELEARRLGDGYMVNRAIRDPRCGFSLMGKEFRPMTWLSR